MLEQIRGNEQCIEIIDRMQRTGRPMRLPILPEELDLWAPAPTTVRVLLVGAA